MSSLEQKENKKRSLFFTKVFYIRLLIIHKICKNRNLLLTKFIFVVK